MDVRIRAAEPSGSIGKSVTTEPDADGRIMHSTVRNVADELASAAELALGKTAGRPVALVRGATFTRGDGSIRDVIIPAANDLFR